MLRALRGLPVTVGRRRERSLEAPVSPSCVHEHTSSKRRPTRSIPGPTAPVPILAHLLIMPHTHAPPPKARCPETHAGLSRCAIQLCDTAKATSQVTWRPASPARLMFFPAFLLPCLSNLTPWQQRLSTPARNSLMGKPVLLFAK